jgi:hypothetical protein
VRILLAALALYAQGAIAGEAVIMSAVQADGVTVPYVLNTGGAVPRFVLILFPGGTGRVDPRLINGELVYGFKGNFLLRSRPYFVDDEFATAATNTTENPERIQAVLDDLARRFPSASIYLIGTSAGTTATMRLSGYLSSRIAGVIHTSSMSEIERFDTRKYRNRQLIVHHRNDLCRVTPFFAAESAHQRFGTDFIAMQGGIAVGDACEAFSYHGFNGIERETANAIKAWVKR